MNCQEVQLQLSGYLEKSLDAIRMKSIESHLSSCPFCRAEVHALSDCIRLVSDLPILDPPAGFTQRVMAHAREIELEPRSWQRFFAAFKVTVPVQTAAVVLVSLLAILLYERQPQVKNLALGEKLLPTVLPYEFQQKANPATENSLTKASEQAPSAKRDRNNPLVAPQPIAKARQHSLSASSSMRDASPAAAEPEKAMEEPLAARVAAPRRPVIQAQEVSTVSESPGPSADALAIGAAIGALSRSPFRPSPFSAERALSPLSEPSPDFEFVVRRHSTARAARNEALRKRSEPTPVATNATERSAASAPATSQVVEIRWFTVAPEHYEQFRKELAAEAIIDAEKSVAAKELDFGLTTTREFLIKVTILPSER
ncbi:MAG TPA: zf-HC2 domain-containing protein [Candidatus Binatia bacterium]|nr:zf-HC2 domain-containing protein [Candidatus Binatia bacterium]